MDSKDSRHLSLGEIKKGHKRGKRDLEDLNIGYGRIVFFTHFLCDMKINISGYFAVGMSQAAGDNIKRNSLFGYERYMCMPHEMCSH